MQPVLLTRTVLPGANRACFPAGHATARQLDATLAPLGHPVWSGDAPCARSLVLRHRDCSCRAATNAAASTSAPVQTESVLPSLADVLPFRPWAVPGTRWRVRPIKQEEIPAVCRIQTEGFHERHGFPPINALLHTMFQAEVMAALHQKLKYADRDNFVCLVAEDQHSPAGIQGVVEVSIASDREVLEVLQQCGLDTDAYAYIACMAVDEVSRRRGIASALLAGAERMAADRWLKDRVLLHVYCDNEAAVELYHRNGYEDLQHDPQWNAFWGRRRRTLMGKELWHK